MFDNAPPWFKWALGEVGVREVPGKGSNPRILAYRKMAKIPIDGDDSEIAWCSVFCGAALEQCGIRGTRSAAARSALTSPAMVELKTPVLGCIVVLARPGSKWQGHVGFYRGETADSVYLLGGNQGDSVSIAPFPKDRVLGYRWPAGVPVPATGVVKIAAGKKLATVSDR